MKSTIKASVFLLLACSTLLAAPLCAASAARGVRYEGGKWSGKEFIEHIHSTLNDANIGIDAVKFAGKINPYDFAVALHYLINNAPPGDLKEIEVDLSRFHADSFAHALCDEDPLNHCSPDVKAIIEEHAFNAEPSGHSRHEIVVGLLGAKKKTPEALISSLRRRIPMTVAQAAAFKQGLAPGLSHFRKSLREQGQHYLAYILFAIYIVDMALYKYLPEVRKDLFENKDSVRISFILTMMTHLTILTLNDYSRNGFCTITKKQFTIILNALMRFFLGSAGIAFIYNAKKDAFPSFALFGVLWLQIYFLLKEKLLER